MVGSELNHGEHQSMKNKRKRRSHEDEREGTATGIYNKSKKIKEVRDSEKSDQSSFMF